MDARRCGRLWLARGNGRPPPLGSFLAAYGATSDIDATAARIAAGNSDAAKAYCANGAIAELLAAYGATSDIDATAARIAAGNSDATQKAPRTPKFGGWLVTRHKKCALHAVASAKSAQTVGLQRQRREKCGSLEFCRLLG